MCPANWTGASYSPLLQAVVQVSAPYKEERFDIRVGEAPDSTDGNLATDTETTGPRIILLLRK